MDTSKEYIKMCQMAKEIQKLKPSPESVEILKWDNDEHRFIIGDYYDFEEGAIWLPRQDQLQEIIHNPNEPGFNICH